MIADAGGERKISKQKNIRIHLTGVSSGIIQFQRTSIPRPATGNSDNQTSMGFYKQMENIQSLQLQEHNIRIPVDAVKSAPEQVKHRGTTRWEKTTAKH
jgi:hypothetical protein